MVCENFNCLPIMFKKKPCNKRTDRQRKPSNVPLAAFWHGTLKMFVVCNRNLRFRSRFAEQKSSVKYVEVTELMKLLGLNMF